MPSFLGIRKSLPLFAIKFLGDLLFQDSKLRIPEIRNLLRCEIHVGLRVRRIESRCEPPQLGVRRDCCSLMWCLVAPDGTDQK